MQWTSETLPQRLVPHTSEGGGASVKTLTQSVMSYGAFQQEVVQNERSAVYLWVAVKSVSVCELASGS